jgi:hypothetical protein
MSARYRSTRSSHTLRGALLFAVCFASFSSLPTPAQTPSGLPAANQASRPASSQTASVVPLPAVPVDAQPTLAADLLLPNAPSARDDGSSVSPGVLAPLPAASHTQEMIQPGQDAPTLNTGDKVLLGLRSAFSPFAAVGWLASAGYEQLLNGSPNYGTDRGAFGQRLGAAALRASSEDVFSESLFAPIFHEDPRYYRLGPSRSLPVRVLYAVTRPLVNRTDKGNNSVNFAFLAGNFAGAELTYAYYPQLNRSQTQILETFGGSIGGSALGYAIYELLGDFTKGFHKQPK